MSFAPGTYVLGPEHGELVVHTRREGAAAKAGHDLEIVVTQWRATLQLGPASSIVLSADSSSLKVREGRGGMQPLDDADKDKIGKTIAEEVLKSTAIEFRSTAIKRTGTAMHVRGELELMGETQPLTFAIKLGEDGRLVGHAEVKQSSWGIKPYSALLGTLRVIDEVEITVEAGIQLT
jgi:polyisoprenoid-binding protein YceI